MVTVCDCSGRNALTDVIVGVDEEVPVITSLTVFDVLDEKLESPLYTA
jgi:hypothetical protein